MELDFIGLKTCYFYNDIEVLIFIHLILWYGPEYFQEKEGPEDEEAY